MMSERVKLGTIEGDIESVIGGLNPDLREYLQQVNTEIIRYPKVVNHPDRLVGSALTNILPKVIKIRVQSIAEIRDAAKKVGVIEPKIGKSKKVDYYHREDILALSAICWYINESFCENGSFDESWVDIVERVKDLLGDDNLISTRLKMPDNPTSKFSTGPISYEMFANGTRKRGSQHGDSVVLEQEPYVPTQREVAAELSKWDEERFRKLHDRIPDLIDSIDSVPMMREVPTSIVEKVMTVYDLNRGNDSAMRRVDKDPVSAALLKTAIRDYLNLAEFFRQIGEPYDISSVEGALMRLRHA